MWHFKNRPTNKTNIFMSIDKLQNLSVEYDQIFFIDCLPEDEYNDWKISQDISQFLSDNGILQNTSICRNKKLVIATLNYVLKLASNETKICLHIVSHGDKDGLWIKSTDEDILWTDFKQLLGQINDAMGGTLLLNMTSCKGLNGIKIVDANATNYPFFGLIGYSVDLEVDRGKDINKMFYEKILNGKQIYDAVSELKKELNDDNLYCISSQGYKIIKSKLSSHK